MGGSGGHADTASGAKVSIIVTPLFKTRLPIIRPEITTITTPGEDIDIVVTERGIAINPKRIDLLEKLKNSHLPIMSIKDLSKIALAYTGIPEVRVKKEQVIGVVRYRDQTIIDTLFQM